MGGNIHQMRGGSCSSSLLLLLVVFIQCYHDVTASPSEYSSNPFLTNDPIYASVANRDSYPTPLYQVRSVPRYYLAAPASSRENDEQDTGLGVILERGQYPEYPRRTDPMGVKREREDENEQEWIQKMMSHHRQLQQQQSPSSLFSLMKRGPVEDFSVTNYKKNVNIPCNSKSPCKKPFDTSFQCKCPNMNQCWAPSAQHDATCKFASPPFGVMFYQP